MASSGDGSAVLKRRKSGFQPDSPPLRRRQTLSQPRQPKSLTYFPTLKSSAP
jgi:hypothetical protein